MVAVTPGVVLELWVIVVPLDVIVVKGVAGDIDVVDSNDIVVGVPDAVVEALSVCTEEVVPDVVVKDVPVRVLPTDTGINLICYSYQLLRFIICPL